MIQLSQAAIRTTDYTDNTEITLRKVRVKIRINSWLKKQIEGLHLRTANHELSQIHTNYSLRYAFVKIRENSWLKKNTVAIVCIRGNTCGLVVEETENGVIMLCMTTFFVNLYDFLTIKSGSIKEKV